MIRPVKSAARSRAAGLLAGALADALLGDPRRGHPVAAFGRAAAAIEQRMYAPSRLRGAAFAGACLALAAAPALAAARAGRARPGAALVLTAASTWAVLGGRSLTAEAGRIQAALTEGDLDRARRLLPALCGRDPGQLDEAGLARAVVESLAENCSDAVVAPLFWGSLSGPGSLAAYRAVNTLDAMVGHHCARYEDFGWASARLDDVANWLPARLTALLTAACSPAVSGDPATTLRVAARYGPRHPSPNAGWCEAAFAGALGVRLGGTLSYGGHIEHRPVLGDGRPPAIADIARASLLCRAVSTAATGLAAAVAASTAG